MRSIKEWAKRLTVSEIYRDIKTVQRLESRDAIFRCIRDMSKDRSGDWHLLFYTGGRTTEMDRGFAIPLSNKDVDNIRQFIDIFDGRNESEK